MSPRAPAVPAGRPFPGATLAPVLAAVVALAAGCGTIRSALSPTPVGRPAGRAGWLVYRLRDLRFEAPAGWRASGGDRSITLEAPDGKVRLEISYPEKDFADEKACLAAAEDTLKGQAGSLARAERHPTKFASLPAQTLQGDQGAWHVWAIAACDRGAQYRIFFTAATPPPPEALEAWRVLVDSADARGSV